MLLDKIEKANDIKKIDKSDYGELAEEIRQCITHYEPRLQQVRVSHSERLEPSRDPLILQFQIEGQIRFAEQARHASFTLQLDSNRRYRMVN